MNLTRRLASRLVRLTSAAVFIAALTAPNALADGLEARVQGAMRGGHATWLAWSVPSAADGVACCWDGREKDSRQPKTCSLSPESHGLNTSRDGAVDPDLSSTRTSRRAGLTPFACSRVRAACPGEPRGWKRWLR